MVDQRPWRACVLPCAQVESSSLSSAPARSHSFAGMRPSSSRCIHPLPSSAHFSFSKEDKSLDFLLLKSPGLRPESMATGPGAECCRRVGLGVLPGAWTRLVVCCDALFVACSCTWVAGRTRATDTCLVMCSLRCATAGCCWQNPGCVCVVICSLRCATARCVCARRWMRPVWRRKHSTIQPIDHKFDHS